MSGVRTRLAAMLGALLVVAAPIFPAAAFQCHVGTITFRDTGEVEGCELEGYHELTTAKDVVIVCASGERASLHPGGALAGCTLAKAYVADGKSCPAGARVALATDGAIAACE